MDETSILALSKVFDETDTTTSFLSLTAEQIKNILQSLYKDQKNWKRDPTSADEAQALSSTYFLYRLGISRSQLTTLERLGLIALKGSAFSIFPHAYVLLTDIGLEFIKACQTSEIG